MTRKELRVLDFIRENIVTAGCAPTLDEIAAHLGMTAKSSAHRIVESLVRQGALVREPHKARNVLLADVPLLTAVPSQVLRDELARRGEAVL
ncbi:LexA family protein [Sphingopyxis flava]|uniref:LexA DNA binding domain-containing protein n=1 Tax=Sphingopyxis flava TaxID=1507287 RepID=A0A1T4ZVS6_9SPHN|nr:helix-turn-helix domain-containing protein [Sphingopyxis flava]SKB26881.1 LexA DNA binding domain-containing protein [Sphingopyxis flava]